MGLAVGAARALESRDVRRRAAQAMAEREAVRLATDKAIDTARSSRAAMRAPNEYRVGG